MFVWKKGPCHISLSDVFASARFVFRSFSVWNIVGGVQHLSKELFKWNGRKKNRRLAKP